MKRNILFLMTDQLRGDCLGYAGHLDVKTPYLDTLAAEGQYFENAYTACPSCIAARASLMTGLSPEHNGRVGYKDGVDWTYETTLAGELSKAGYDTQCVGKMHVHPLRNKLGFHNVQLHDGYMAYYRRITTPYYEHQAVADDYFHWLKNEKGIDADITDTGLECNSFVARPWIYDEESHPTNWVARGCIDYLRRRDRSKPFFLFASFVRPHPPFDAPACYFDMYKDKDLRPPFMGEWADRETVKRSGYRYDSSEGALDPELMRQAQVGYYACLTHLDHQIGRIFHALEQEGILNDTIILFCSDHGELLGDHHTFRKTRPYQGSVHVPLFFRIPGEKGGVRYGTATCLEDIMPTLIDLAGGEIPAGLDGVSLLPIIRGEKETAHELVHGEHSGGALGNHYLVSDHDKYIWYDESGREQYFDLATDPNELRDRIDDPACAERIAYLRGELVRMLKDRPEGYSDGEKLIPGRPQLAVLFE